MGNWLVSYFWGNPKKMVPRRSADSQIPGPEILLTLPLKNIFSLKENKNKNSNLTKRINEIILIMNIQEFKNRKNSI